MAQQKFTCALAIVMLVVVAVGQVNCNQLSSFMRCDNNEDIVLEQFKVTGCEEASQERCQLKRGKDIHVYAKFTSDKIIAQAESGISITGYGFSGDACQLGLRCRSPGIKQQAFVHTINIPESLPVRTGDLADTLVLHLRDTRRQKRLLCIKYPIEIV